MRNRNYLARGTKPYQYYYFHCIIPKDLRGILGKSVIRISLKNSDYCYSKIVSNSLYIIAQNIFENIREGHMQDITLEDVKDILRQKFKQTIKHIDLYQWKTNKWEPLELAKRIEEIYKKEKKILSRLQTDFIETNEIISKEIDKILIKKNLKPDKQNYEYAGLISRWTDLKVLRETWKRDLLNGERKTVNEYEQELEEKWKLDLFIEEKLKESQSSIIIENSASEPKERRRPPPGTSPDWSRPGSLQKKEHRSPDFDSSCRDCPQRPGRRVLADARHSVGTAHAVHKGWSAGCPRPDPDPDGRCRPSLPP